MENGSPIHTGADTCNCLGALHFNCCLSHLCPSCTDCFLRRTAYFNSESPTPSTASEQCIMNVCPPKNFSFVHSLITEEWLIEALVVNWGVIKSITGPWHHPGSSPTKVIFLSFWSLLGPPLYLLLKRSSTYPLKNTSLIQLKTLAEGFLWEAWVGRGPCHYEAHNVTGEA